MRRLGRGREWSHFENRHDAGRQLAGAIRDRAFENPVVLGIPRGGVVVSFEVARAIGAEHGVIVSRKLGAPYQPELAVGAVTASGVAYIDTETAEMAGADAAYLAVERDRQMQEAQRREALFAVQHRPAINNRVVIVVDDGVATGATAIAAIRAVKAEGGRRVIFAAPVGPPATIAALSREADEVICLHEKPDFLAVGLFYLDFRPVEDEDVVALLTAEAPQPTPATREPS